MFKVTTYSYPSTCFTHCSSVSMFDFEQINTGFEARRGNFQCVDFFSKCITKIDIVILGFTSALFF